MRVLPYHLPLVAAFGRGSRIWDVDHNEYVDLNMAYGPLLFGHCPPHVIEAVTDQIDGRGSQLGFPTEITIRVAEKIKQLFPSMELMRFANSGTEADVSATRLARVYTGRPKIIQFEGHYHGWSDTLFNRYHALLDELPTGPYGPALPGTAGLIGAARESVGSVERYRRPATMPRRSSGPDRRGHHGAGHGKLRRHSTPSRLPRKRPQGDDRARGAVDL